MTLKWNKKLLFAIALAFWISAVSASLALAAKKMKIAPTESDDRPSASSSSSGGGIFSKTSYKQMILADLSAHYVRNADVVMSSDTALRGSIAGMFNSWIGLGATGMLGMKSKDYLLGAELRLMPIDWFFVKGGLGGYSDKSKGTFRGTPLLGGGILARFNPDMYLVSEMSYFQAGGDNLISFGAGLGVVF